jgi:hypothetical protein
MVTKTRAKLLPEIGVQPIELTSDSRAAIAEALNIHSKRQKEHLAKAVTAIADCLKHCNHRLVSISSRPLAPHIVAALRPIEATAGELVAHLTVSTLPVAVLRELGATHDELYNLQQMILGLQSSAQSAIERLETINTAGVPVKEFGEILEHSLVILGNLFEAYRLTPEDEDAAERAAPKAEFLRVSRGYLPPAPTKRKQKKRA